MRRGSCLTTILALSVLFIVCCSCSKIEDNNTSAGKSAGDTLVVGFECGFRPHGFLDSKTGEYIGFDLDLIREIARRRKWKCVLKPIEWTMKRQLLDSGEIDCICNGFTMEGREEEYEWSTPYLMSYQTVVVRKDSDIKNFDDLAGKTVGVQSGTPIETDLNYGEFSDLGRTFANLRPIDDYHILMKTLSTTTELDAVIVDHVAAAAWINDYDRTLHITGMTFSRIHDAIALKKGNEKLCEQIDDTMMEMVKDGTFARLCKKWFGYTKVSDFTSKRKKQ